VNQGGASPEKRIVKTGASVNRSTWGTPGDGEVQIP